jgi:hemerythrin
MKESNVLTHEDVPQVAMDTMNEVHQEELTIVNNLYSAILANNNDKISELCLQWVEHTKDHFNNENTMMEKYGFPAYHCHHSEHTEALALLQSTVQDWNNQHDIEALTLYVKDSWPQWYVNHISTMDTITSAFIKQRISSE